MINEPIDLLTYSSPCQDFSSAGLQKGGQQGSGTRSSLLWECERGIEQLRPKYLLFENVSALVSEKFNTYEE
jgi:DNA (cytosine-5)-methyltransferase 1